MKLNETNSNEIRFIKKSLEIYFEFIQEVRRSRRNDDNMLEILEFI